MNSYEATGILTHEQLKKTNPPIERLEKGPVAIIECVQNVPCDPCAYVCRVGAIRKKSIVDSPEVDHQKCTGCGECVAVCPGLAIFVVNLKYGNDEALVVIPYEFLPTPKKGEIYEALDREGKSLGEARVIAAKMLENRTVILTIAVKKDFAMMIRNIGRKLK